MRKIFTILFFCASAHTARAVDVSAVHFRSAGVDLAAQKYLLQWTFPNANDTADIKNVQVLRLAKDEQENITLDTIDVLGSRVRRYVDDNNSCCAPAAYALRLLDKNPQFPSTTTDLFCTMQLNSPALDTCANAINLRWSACQKFDKFYYEPVAEFAEEVRYHIYGCAGDSTMFNPDSVKWLASCGTATSYALPVVAEKKHHHLLIAAVYNNGSDTSYSNRVQIFTPLSVRPRRISIDSALVSEQSTTLHFQIDNSTEYSRFWAEKSNDASVGFTRFAEFGSKQQTSITHSAGGNNIAFYRISSVNSCGRVTASSPAAATLGVNVYGSNSVSYISWNAISYNGHEASYNVYRTSPPALAATLGSALQTTSITDDLSLLPDSAIGATFCYTVEAATPNGYYVRSVNACYTIAPQAYMPNAIQLSGSSVNTATGKSRNLFEPVSSHALTYTMRIYSRTGKQLYSGQQAWNGRENNTGEFVTEGSYVYFIKINFANGSRAELTGNVTVVY